MKKTVLKFALLLSTVAFASIIHAQDPCQNLTGYWQGTWETVGCHACHYAVTVFAEEHDGTVQMHAYNFSKLDNKCFCYPPADFTMRGTCLGGEINTEGLLGLRGKISGNEINLYTMDLDSSNNVHLTKTN